MPEITPAEIEADARALLREKIRRMPWHQGLSAEERDRRIEEDIERDWPMMVEEAARRLVDRLHPLAPPGDAQRGFSPIQPLQFGYTQTGVVGWAERERTAAANPSTALSGP